MNAVATIREREDGKFVVEMILENNIPVDGWEEVYETMERAQGAAERMQLDWNETDAE